MTSTQDEPKKDTVRTINVEVYNVLLLVKQRVERQRRFGDSSFADNALSDLEAVSFDEDLHFVLESLKDG